MKRITFEGLQRLVIGCVNEVLDRWAGKESIVEYSMTYVVDDDLRIKVWPTHSATAHCFGDIIQVADALGFPWYVDTTINQDGLQTPRLVIFDA